MIILLKIFINESYKLPKSIYEYCLTHFMYPDYNKAPKGTIYHNTHIENVESILKTGLVASKGRQLEYQGEMTWATTLTNQKGYGGITIAFTLDGLENKYDYDKVNDYEYTIYADVPTKNIIFVDLPVVTATFGELYRLSDIPELIDEYGYDDVKSVFAEIAEHGTEYVPLDVIMPCIK